MKRKQRTWILVNGDPQIRKDFSRQVSENAQVNEIVPPRKCLTMIKVRETSRGTPFYMGEVLATECKVRIGEKLGLGIIRGHQSEAARDLARIDAAFNSNLSMVKEWKGILLEEEKRILREKELVAARVRETLVDFKTMDNGEESK